MSDPTRPPPGRGAAEPESRGAAKPEPVTLDATGLKCPLPVLKARKAMKDLPPGAILRIRTTDPGAAKDFEHFCKTTGATLLNASETDGVTTFELRKPG